MRFESNYRLLRVDLSNEKITTEELDQEVMRKYLGGTGLTAKKLWDETRVDTQPLSEENVLIFAVGPVTATLVPGSGRFTVASISPLTNIWGEAHAGGKWATALRRAGYLGIVVTGKARNPVYIWVRDGGARIVNASHLWGKDTFEIEPILKQETDERASVAAIGPAGEKLVRYATVMVDGPAAKCAGRCGIGAVMGSKNLKAIVVAGTGRPQVYDNEKLRESINRYFPKTRKPPPGQPDPRLRRAFLWTDERGSIKNHQLGEFTKEFSEKVWRSFERGTPLYCSHCITGCAAAKMWNGMRNNHAECQIPMGSNLLIDDMEVLDQAFEFCSRNGMDTISTGDTIAFAMELFERGMITPKDTEGIDLTWGNKDALLPILEKIVDDEGIGKLLRLGVRQAAKQVGGLAEEFAMHVKGLEPSMHDPRRNNAIALQCATNSRGADHMEGLLGIYVQGLLPGYQPQGYAFLYLDDEKAKAAANNPFAVEGMGKFVCWAQDFSNVVDSLVMCQFMGYPLGWIEEPIEPFAGVQPTHMAEWLSLVTGWDIDLKELMRIGERIFNLKRLFNVRRGISRKDDTLPPRLLTHKRGGHGPAANNLPALGIMLNDYYSCRGWDEVGIPTKEKLAELGVI